MAKQKNLYRDHHFNQIKTGWNVVFSIILCLISLLMLIPLVLGSSSFPSPPKPLSR